MKYFFIFSPPSYFLFHIWFPRGLCTLWKIGQGLQKLIVGLDSKFMCTAGDISEIHLRISWCEHVQTVHLFPCDNVYCVQVMHLMKWLMYIVNLLKRIQNSKFELQVDQYTTSSELWVRYGGDQLFSKLVTCSFFNLHCKFNLFKVQS